MGTARRASRVTGSLIILQMVGSGLVNFALSGPFLVEPGFLASAAAHWQQIGVSVFLGLVTGGIFVGIAVTTFPIFRQYSQAMALWFITLAVVSLAIVVVEQIDVMSMVSLSEAYAKASPVARDQFEGSGVVAASARDWAHLLGRIADGSALFVFYALLYRFALVPRALAAFGLVAVMLQLTGLAMPFFGRDVVFPLLAPLGLTQLLLALWLIIKGFPRAVT
jgi:hypothetical protein